MRLLDQLVDRGTVLTLLLNNEIVGFFGSEKDFILLHALSEKIRGKGLAKYYWTEACRKLFEQGFDEIRPLISTDNLAILNLYASLGFRFRDALHCFHRFKVVP